MPTAARRNDGTVNDRRRPRTPAKPKPAPQLTGPVQLDDDTRNALILFNARLVAQEELEREKRRVDKASKAKDEAAATVRRLESDPKATAEQKSEAQAAYLASLDALNRAKAGEPPASGAAEATGDNDHEAADDEPAAPTVDDEGEAEETQTAQPEAEAEAEEDETAEPEAVEAETAGVDDEPAAPTVEAEAEPAVEIEAPVEAEADAPVEAEAEPAAETDAPADTDDESA